MIRFTIPDMSCAHCVKAITDTVKAMDATATVEVELRQKTVSVQSRLADADIREALTQAGYPPAP